jgi:hypothetical protein
MTRKLLPFLLLALSAPAWGAYAYSYHPTLSHTMVSGSSDLATYTVYVHLSGTDFKDVAHGGLIQNSTTFNGQTVPADFQEDTTSTCTGSLGSTRDYFDIEKWDNVNGTIDMFVGPITLSHTADWTPYFCMDAAAVTTYQGGTVGQAWASRYLIVNHMANVTTGLDSTANGNTLTRSDSTYITNTAGLIDGAAAIANVSTYMYTSPFTPPTTFSVSALAYCTNLTSTGGGNYIAGMQTGTVDWQLSFNDLGGANPPRLLVNNGGYNSVTGPNLSINTWYYIKGTYNGSTIALYINGTQYTASSAGTLNTTSMKLIVGNLESTEQYVNPFNGTLDEFRFSNVADSAAETITETNNLMNFASYWTLGSKSAVGGGAATVTMTPIIM